jgi:hypothetical protein
MVTLAVHTGDDGDLILEHSLREVASDMRADLLETVCHDAWED